MNLIIATYVRIPSLGVFSSLVASRMQILSLDFVSKDGLSLPTATPQQGQSPLMRMSSSGRRQLSFVARPACLLSAFSKSTEPRPPNHNAFPSQNPGPCLPHRLTTYGSNPGMQMSTPTPTPSQTLFPRSPPGPLALTFQGDTYVFAMRSPALNHAVATKAIALN